MTLEVFLAQSEQEMLSCLEPYQQELVNELLRTTKGDCLAAADKWLNSNMSQTVAFGGEKKHSVFRDKLFEELEKFICGCDDGRYEAERKELQETSTKGKDAILCAISGAIGAQIGVAGVFVAPALVLIFQSIGKIVINAWCETQKANRLALQEHPNTTEP